VLQCVAACCSALQRLAASCSVLRCVGACCSVLQWVDVLKTLAQLYSNYTKWHCNTLQHNATQCNTLISNAYKADFCECSRADKMRVLQCVAVCCSVLQFVSKMTMKLTFGTPHRETIGWETKGHCNTLQHTATHCNALQHTATCCNTLISNDYKADFCDSSRGDKGRRDKGTLQHIATRCNMLQHTATHVYQIKLIFGDARGKTRGGGVFVLNMLLGATYLYLYISKQHIYIYTYIHISTYIYIYWDFSFGGNLTHHIRWLFWKQIRVSNDHTARYLYTRWLLKNIAIYQMTLK